MMIKLSTLYRTENGIPYDVTWETFRESRDLALLATDVHLLVDKYNALTEEQQEAITTFRQWLRDATKNYDSANDAVDNWPQPEDWF
jgi:hypothetical protein